MTEKEWLTKTNAMPMVRFLRGKTSDRKLRLFAVACCRYQGKGNRQSQSGRPVICSVCGSTCERAVGNIRVPSPKHTKAWDKFWVQYKAEMELLDAYGRGELREAVTLELFNLRLPKRRRTKSCS